MITLDDVTVVYRSPERIVAPLRNTSATIPSDKRVGILGSPKSGKSTLIRLLCGLEIPSAGRVYADARVSYPIGSAIGIVSHHSLRRNCLFAARVYRCDGVALIKLIAEAGNLSDYMDVRFKDAPSEVTLRFRYALSLALPFDTYLVDSTPLPRMEDASGLSDLFETRASSCGLIICTGNEAHVEKYCDLVYLLHDGRLVLQPNQQEAVNTFRNQRRFSARLGASTVGAERLLREARSLIRQKDFEQAEKTSREFYEAYPDSLESLLLLADLALARDDLSTATALVKQACRLYPLALEPWIALQRLLSDSEDVQDVKYWAMRMTNHDDPKIRMTGARAIENVGSVADALEAWRKVPRPNPESVVGLLESAQFEFNTQNFLEALSILESAISLDPTAWRALLLKAKAERALGRFQDLAETVAKIAVLKPEASYQYQRVLEQHAKKENENPDGDENAGAARGPIST